MNDYVEIDRYLEENLDLSLAELSRYCAQPSIAAQNLGLKECAEMTAAMLKARGFDVEITPTGGAPIVYGGIKGRSDRTLLFYNHYDVQPADPLDLWESPPFEPTLRDGKLYGRGVSDDKGHITSRLHAIDALLAVEGDLPCNVKFVVEGEEEISSEHIPGYVKNNRRKLAANACIWEFGGVNHNGSPDLTLGMRGICYVELSTQTASIDAHSGLGGSIFPNAAWRLVWALNSLKTQDERIRLPGFYDAVRPPTPQDVAYLEALPEVAGEYKQRYGLKTFLGGIEGELDLRKQGVFEPTCTICGLTSGYQGEGSKTVLPAQASAKVDFRLVPDQTPEQVLDGLRAHLDAEGFSDVSVKFLGGTPPARTDPDHPFIQLVMNTAARVYGKAPVLYPMIGGSGPNHVFMETLEIPIATSGISYPGTNAHAPNENIRLDLYLLGAKHMVRILDEFGNGSSGAD